VGSLIQSRWCVNSSKKGLEELDELLRDAPTDEERGRIRQARHLLLVNYRKAPWYANWLTSSPLADDGDPPGRSDA